VNLANRLEQNAPAGGILVSHDTFRHIYGLFDLQALPPFTVKGRPEPVQTYLIFRPKPRALAVQLRGIEGIETEMIGRERELNQLGQALQQVIHEGTARVISVVGEAGIGKSCLLNEFQKWAEVMPHTVRWFYGRATPEMIALPFSLLRDVFASRFEIRDSDAQGVAREKLESGIANMLADKPSARKEAVVAAHFIGQLVGLDFSSSPSLRDILNDPQQIRQIALNSLTQFFTAATSRALPTIRGDPIKGAILVAEDIHWGDDASLDVLLHLARTCKSVPLLILCFTRPTLFERRSHWIEGFEAHQTIELNPLSRESSIALVHSILRKAPSIPEALRDLVISSAEGVPFYIEELIKMLIDQKVVLPGDEHWKIEPDKLAAAAVPATLTGVLQARLDGLLPAERTLLQRASVIGRVFWDSALESFGSPVFAEPAASAGETTIDKAELSHALAGLRQKELILRRESSAFAGAVEYMFKHELLRNVAYESLLKKSRRTHHAAVAEWLIEASGERINEVAALVASHFEQAGNQAEAAEWYGRAGEKAREGYAFATAIESFRKALALLPPGQANSRPSILKRIEWQQSLGEVLTAQAKFSEGLDACNLARDLAQTLGDPLAEARAWNGLSFLNERLGRNRASVECAERAEALADELGEAGMIERVRALLLKGWAYYRLSDAGAVLALGEQTHRLCVEFGNRHGLATSYKLHGVAHLQLGHFSEADRFFEQGLVLYRELGDRRNTAAMWSNLGESARFRGDYEAAEKLYEKALAAVREIGHRESESIYLTNLSGARLGLRKFSEAESDLREAIRLTDGNNFCSLSETFSALSETCLAQGKLDEALATAQRGLTLARESENDLDLGTALRVLGQALSATTDPNGASALFPGSQSDPDAAFAESLAVFHKIKAEVEQARTLRAWARHDLDQGRRKHGESKLRQARDLFFKLGARGEVTDTETLLQESPRQTYP
jgi:predicted ATPase